MSAACIGRKEEEEEEDEKEKKTKKRKDWGSSFLL
jgi:hypothetical protein